PAETERTDADGPAGEVEDPETRVALAEFAVLQRHEAGMSRLQPRLERGPGAALPQFHREDRRDVAAMEKRLGIGQRHKDAAILEAVLVANHPRDAKAATADLHRLARLRPQKLRRPRAQDDLPGADAELLPPALKPGRARQPRIIRLEA